jgi:hypothetical protein
MYSVVEDGLAAARQHLCKFIWRETKLPSERGLWVVEQRGLEMSLRLIFGQAE